MIALVFDVETDGLIANRLVSMDLQPRVTEVCLFEIDFVNKTSRELFTTLINPGVPIPPKITKITGIRDEDVKDAPDFSVVSVLIKEIIQDYGLVISHNVAFDMEILDIQYQRLKQERIRWGRGICTIEQTMHFKGFRLNLQALHEFLFNEKFKEAHRAKVDVMALVRCCHELYSRGAI